MYGYCACLIKCMSHSTVNMKGGLAIAVPGAIRGFELAWQRFGRLEWHELFEPAVRVATDGVPISGAVAGAISAVAQSSILSGLYPGLTYETACSIVVILMCPVI